MPPATRAGGTHASTPFISERLSAAPLLVRAETPCPDLSGCEKVRTDVQLTFSRTFTVTNRGPALSDNLS